MQKLIVHSKKSCSDCVKLYVWLKKKGIDFTMQYDLTKDQIAPQIYIYHKNNEHLKDDVILTGIDECLTWLKVKYD